MRGSRPVYVTAAEIQGPVHARAGPWRICGEWWTENSWDYEEWDVEVRGRLLVIPPLLGNLPERVEDVCPGLIIRLMEERPR